MTRPFWQTLAFKLTLAFVLVSAFALGAVGVISYVSTRAEFNRFIGEQARTLLVQRLQAHYEQNGSFAGFRAEDPGPFVVLGPRRVRTLFGTEQFPPGAYLPPELAAQATPVTVNGTVVAYVAPSGNTPRLSRRSQEFLSKTTSAILWAMLTAALIAILMGLLVARALLSPLRDLLRGIQAMQHGEAPVVPPRVRNDEFGEVVGAFHHMHHAVIRNQEARQQLTANIAHDLNTPLSVISGTLEAMLDGTFKPTVERLSRLHRETKHVASLVNDLRFLSLVDAGEFKLTLDEHDVPRVVGDAVEGVRELTVRGGVQLDFVVSDAPVLAKVDARRVTQVMQNLLSNALTYTPEGGQIEVRVARVGGNARVTVKDTGSGIAAEKVPFVFERLYRADESRSTSGSGLGLSICKSIVEAHGGTISIESATGAGTTVTFDLPVVTSGVPHSIPS